MSKQTQLPYGPPQLAAGLSGIAAPSSDGGGRTAIGNGTASARAPHTAAPAPLQGEVVELTDTAAAIAAADSAANGFVLQQPRRAHVDEAPPATSFVGVLRGATQPRRPAQPAGPLRGFVRTVPHTSTNQFLLPRAPGRGPSAAKRQPLPLDGNKPIPKFLRYFEELSTVGSGNFSDVLRVRSRMDGCTYAIKRRRHGVHLRHGGWTADGAPNAARVHELREVHAVAALAASPHVLRYFSAWREDDVLYIQTELAWGSLEDAIIGRRPGPRGTRRVVPPPAVEDAAAAGAGDGAGGDRAAPAPAFEQTRAPPPLSVRPKARMRQRYRGDSSVDGDGADGGPRFGGGVGDLFGHRGGGGAGAIPSSLDSSRGGGVGAEAGVEAPRPSVAVAQSPHRPGAAPNESITSAEAKAHYWQVRDALLGSDIAEAPAGGGTGVEAEVDVAVPRLTRAPSASSSYSLMSVDAGDDGMSSSSSIAGPSPRRERPIAPPGIGRRFDFEAEPITSLPLPVPEGIAAGADSARVQPTPRVLGFGQTADSTAAAGIGVSPAALPPPLPGAGTGTSAAAWSASARRRRVPSSDYGGVAAMPRVQSFAGAPIAPTAGRSFNFGTRLAHPMGATAMAAAAAASGTNARKRERQLSLQESFGHSARTSLSADKTAGDDDHGAEGRSGVTKRALRAAHTAAGGGRGDVSPQSAADPQSLSQHQSQLHGHVYIPFSQLPSQVEEGDEEEDKDDEDGSRQGDGRHGASHRGILWSSSGPTATGGRAGGRAEDSAALIHGAHSSFASRRRPPSAVPEEEGEEGEGAGVRGAVRFDMSQDTNGGAVRRQTSAPRPRRQQQQQSWLDAPPPDSLEGDDAQQPLLPNDREDSAMFGASQASVFSVAPTGGKRAAFGGMDAEAVAAPRYRLSAEDLVLVARHIASGLNFMHAHGLAHLDVKPANILVTYASGAAAIDAEGEWLPEAAALTGLPSLDAAVAAPVIAHAVATTAAAASGEAPPPPPEGSPDVAGLDAARLMRLLPVTYKLGDLGQVAPLGAADVVEGDSRYLSRELLNGDTRNLAAADMFSLGMTLIELATGHGLPTGDDDYAALRDGILPFTELEHLPIGVVQLMAELIHPDPEKRPTAAEVLRSPLVHGLEFDGTGVASWAANVPPELLRTPAEGEAEEGAAAAAAAEVGEQGSEPAREAASTNDPTEAAEPLDASSLPELVTMIEHALRALDGDGATTGTPALVAPVHDLSSVATATTADAFASPSPAHKSGNAAEPPFHYAAAATPAGGDAVPTIATATHRLLATSAATLTDSSRPHDRNYSGAALVEGGSWRAPSLTSPENNVEGVRHAGGNGSITLTAKAARTLVARLRGVLSAAAPV